VTSTPVHKFILRVDLRTLGGTAFAQNLGAQTTSTAPTP
jgi:hypothetical protein